MDSFTGRLLILWTVRIAVTLYALAMWRYLFLSRSGRKNGDQRFAILWASAWLMTVVHVVCAFHFQHHWSHTAAWQHTSDMTNRVVGLDWGGGLIVNYVFLTWWGIDAGRLFRRSDTATSSTIFVAVAAFMFFNATAVFGPPWWWIPVSVFIAAVVIAAICGRWRRPDSGQFPPNTD
ncbi:hypothetical protein [Fuerstiella marisgermanici]|uniref:Uncharacterized protein n=1 Tax=Fuerstiella marisgermanici TaxID=1891926 RepID=A0A1P8WAN1_9PLAN|nr:hypothetical protein [Fuerstiella marisgermanici]APZ91113.1 hypothetical protein Fuma_00699 [Fuerstiella marisgermanici]